MKMSTWLFRGVIKMSTFVHDGGRGGQIFEKTGHVVCVHPPTECSMCSLGANTPREWGTLG